MKMKIATLSRKSKRHCANAGLPIPRCCRPVSCWSIAKNAALRYFQTRKAKSSMRSFQKKAKRRRYTCTKNASSRTCVSVTLHVEAANHDGQDHQIRTGVAETAYPSAVPGLPAKRHRTCLYRG